jgi:hypothetical protein
MKNPLSKFLGLLALVLVFFGGYSAYNATTPEPNLGATNPIPTVVALFETTLASSISADATSFNLTSGMTKDGVTLASSTYGFIIDEGTASEEFVLADCTNTVCTNVQRGISVISGTSTVASLKKAHRRGASVKITNGPQLMIITNVFNGIQGFPEIVKYDGSISTSSIAADGDNLVSVDLLNSVAFDTSGVVPATEASAGFVELATQSEMGSAAETGTNGTLVVQSKYSTSTSPGSGIWNIVSLATGFISESWLPKTLTELYTYSPTTITGHAETEIVTFTSSGTWTKDAGLEYIIVEGIAGGGSGGGAFSNDANEESGGSGGGSGGYFKKKIPASSLPATVTVTVGTGGTGSAGSGGGSWSANGVVGNSTIFEGFATSTGGGAGSSGTTGGGSGGTSTGGDINITGGTGGFGLSISEDNGRQGYYPGDGGPGFFGGVGAYGSGSRGGYDGNSSAASNGIVIVTEYY